VHDVKPQMRFSGLDSFGPRMRGFVGRAACVANRPPRGASAILETLLFPMKRVIFGLLALTLVTGWASPGWAAGLKLTIREGRVSLDAQDVTLRQILTEWARVGKTRILNLERVNSGPVTLKFDNLPEDQALEIILRTLPGYWAAPRPALMADASRYDRIGLMTTTTAVAASPTRPASQTFQDYSPNVTRLGAAQPPLNPGVLPEPPDDPTDANDPAIALATAAGLRPAPAPASMPGTVSPPLGPLQPPVRTGTGSPAAQTPPPTTFGVPAGTAKPGLAPPPPPPSTTRPVGAPRPQQADQ
jgi:hypothetical protein